jgi:hypothetical protein
MRHTVRLALPLSAALAASLAASPAAAQSTTLDFEDLAYHTSGMPVLWLGGPIVGEYAGLTWTNFRPLDLGNYPLGRPDADPGVVGNAGYPDAPQFGDVLGLAFGPVRLQSANPGTLFSIEDGAFGSGWTDPVMLTATGLRGGTTLFSQVFSLGATMTALLDFPDLLVDELVLTPDFLPPGYTDPYGSATANGGVPFQTFWMDNLALTVQAVPEPGTLALVAGGLALAAALARRRRR